MSLKQPFFTVSTIIIIIIIIIIIMVYSQYIHIKGCGSSSVKAYNTNFNMSLISTIYNKIYTWMQIMIKKKKFYRKIYTWFLCLYGGDKARAFKNALQSLQYSLKSLQFLIFAGKMEITHTISK